MLSILMMILGVNASAASKGEIWDLLQRVDSELRLYNQSPETLEQVKGKLQDALQVLRSGPVANPRECMDFAFGEYQKDGFSNGTSLEKSKVFCDRLVGADTTLNVMKYFYGVIKLDGFSSSTSLDQSWMLGKTVTERALPCVQSSYERYARDGFSHRTSLEKAVAICR